jgi:uncharacterized protein (TIGR02328 family)
MRLWHYKILPYLPKSQLIAQWRELNSIFKKQDKHILINYVYEYNGDDLYHYTLLVLGEMINRKIEIRNLQNMVYYFQLSDEITYQLLPNANQCIYLIKDKYKPFKNHHTNRYLLQCFFNLQEKYDRGQKDFDTEVFRNLVIFVDNELNNNCDLLLNLT